MKTIKVYAIKNADNEWYTGGFSNGQPVFNAASGTAIELDSDEVAEEMESMPEGVEAVVIHEFQARQK